MLAVQGHSTQWLFMWVLRYRKGPHACMTTWPTELSSTFQKILIINAFTALAYRKAHYKRHLIVLNLNGWCIGSYFITRQIVNIYSNLFMYIFHGYIWQYCFAKYSILFLYLLSEAFVEWMVSSYCIILLQQCLFGPFTTTSSLLKYQHYWVSALCSFFYGGRVTWYPPTPFVAYINGPFDQTRTLTQVYNSHYVS